MNSDQIVLILTSDQKDLKINMGEFFEDNTFDEYFFVLGEINYSRLSKLLDNGFDVNTQDKWDDTMLMFLPGTGTGTT